MFEAAILLSLSSMFAELSVYDFYAHQICLSLNRLISDKYWVSCNSSGKMEFWDLEAAVNSNHTGPLMLYQLNATTNYCPLLCPIIRADEYQIALIPCRAQDYSELHVLDFLQLDQKVANRFSQ